MYDASFVEGYYKKYIKSLKELLPEGIFEVNLQLLQQMDLLHFRSPHYQEPNITHHFQVVEAPDKMTLINDEFIIWIKANKTEFETNTLVLIAIQTEDQPHLELAFVASGVYNSSRLVLRVLNKFLIDIQETEGILRQLAC